MLTIAAVVLTSAALGAHPYELGGINSRDTFLADPPPYPAHHVDSPDRLENGRLWYPRTFTNRHTPTREARYGSHTAADYGAHPHENKRVIYTHVVHQVIAISPWANYNNQIQTGEGSPQYKRAANYWLREQGYVLKVRTHVNSRYLDQHASVGNAHMEHASIDSIDDSGTRYGPDGLPLPRATIRIDRIERTKIEPRASIDPTRIVKPTNAAMTGPAISYDEYLAQRETKSVQAAASAREAQENIATLSSAHQNDEQPESPKL